MKTMVLHSGLKNKILNVFTGLQTMMMQYSEIQKTENDFVNGSLFIYEE